MPAGERISGEEFRSLRCGSSGEAKGERERTARGSYRDVSVLDLRPGNGRNQEE
jgi:hypothetical protein